MPDERNVIETVGEVGPVLVSGVPGGKTIVLIVRPDSAPARGKIAVVLTNDQSVALARLLISTAKANGYEAGDAS